MFKTNKKSVKNKISNKTQNAIYKNKNSLIKQKWNAKKLKQKKNKTKTKIKKIFSIKIKLYKYWKFIDCLKKKIFANC